MYSNRRSFLKFLCKTVVSASLPVFLSRKALGDPRRIIIGMIEPLTGPYALFGAESRDGALLALEQINREGGVLGSKLELRWYDFDQPQKAYQYALRLSRNDGALAIIGPSTNASSNIVISNLAEKDRIPFLISNSFTEEAFDVETNFTFRILPGINLVAEQSLSYLSEISSKIGVSIRTISLFWRELSVINKSIHHFKRVATEKGFQINFDYPFTGSPDFHSTLERVKRLDTDILVFNGGLLNAINLTKKMRELKAFPKAVVGFSTLAFSNPAFVARMDNLFLNVMDANYWWNPKLGASARLKKDFFQKYKKPLSNNALNAYTAIYTFGDAIRKSGVASRERLASELRKGIFRNHTFAQKGPIQFDERGRNINATSVLLQVMNPVPKVIYPGPFSEAEPFFMLGRRMRLNEWEQAKLML